MQPPCTDMSHSDVHAPSVLDPDSVHDKRTCATDEAPIALSGQSMKNTSEGTTITQNSVPSEVGAVLLEAQAAVHAAAAAVMNQTTDFDKGPAERGESSIAIFRRQANDIFLLKRTSMRKPLFEAWKHRLSHL